MGEITILGEAVNTGAYLLRIAVTEDLFVVFGRFQQGKPIIIQRGEYLYIGSAMASKGSMTLARRLLRHATRQDRNRPHYIREKLLTALQEIELGSEDLQPPSQKKLFWNVDYLLEEEAVILSQIVIVRSRINLEDSLAHFLMNQPESSIVCKGLGAQDKRDQTHLLAIKGSSEWWQQLPVDADLFLQNKENRYRRWRK